MGMPFGMGTMRSIPPLIPGMDAIDPPPSIFIPAIEPVSAPCCCANAGRGATAAITAVTAIQAAARERAWVSTAAFHRGRAGGWRSSSNT